MNIIPAQFSSVLQPVQELSGLASYSREMVHPGK